MFSDNKTANWEERNLEKGKLLPEGYIPRLIDRALSDRLEQTGAVEVTGTMWCGKT